MFYSSFQVSLHINKEYLSNKMKSVARGISQGVSKYKLIQVSIFMQRHVLVYLCMTTNKLNYAFMTIEKLENLQLES